MRRHTVYTHTREKSRGWCSNVLDVSCISSGASVCGNDESTGDHTPADAADTSTAGSFSSAAPSAPSTTTGRHASAGTLAFTFSRM